MLRKTSLIAAAAIAGIFAAAQDASAQTTTTCSGRVFIDTVYQTGVGGQNYEYFLQIRNGTPTAITATVVLSGFGSSVTLFSPTLSGINIGPNASLPAIRFGRGTNGQINAGTVSVGYDGVAPAGRPGVRAINCRSLG